MEHNKLDWKSVWKDEYLEWICAFANTDGGFLEIGKNDKGEVMEKHTTEKVLNDVPKKISTHLGIVADVRLENEGGKAFVRIEVKPYPDAISYKGSYYVRSGSNVIRLNGNALEEFLLRKRGKTWDSVGLTDVTIDDLDVVAFRDFRKKAIKSKRLTEKDLDITNGELLNSLELTNKAQLNRAAVLLFHENPNKFVFGCTCKIGYFETDSELLYQDEVTGPIIMMANKVIELLYSKYFKGYIRYEGLQRIDDFPVPQEAMREAVLNAIVHRDYSTNIPIQIKVYPDRVIIWNDGVFPHDLTLTKLLSKHRSSPHNPLIANAFFRSGQIEAWGRGIDKIRTECKNEDKKEPKFTISESVFEVEFTFERAKNIEGINKGINKGINPENEQILCLMRENKNISTGELANITGLTSKQVEYRINALKKNGKLERSGAKKNGEWIVKN